MKKIPCASMCMTLSISAWLPILLASPFASAAVAFKCTSRDGAVSFQDRPCAANERVETVHLADDPPPATYGDKGPAVVPEDVSAKVAETVEAPSPRSPQSGYLCTREDGTRYLSESGIAQRRAVPLAMLGVPGRGLADAYGPGGAGISAPEVRAPSNNRSSQGSLGAAYVWVEDTCARADGEQVCAFLSDEIDAGERKLRLAFSDTAAQVRADIAALRTRAIDCAL